jgi:hypothetical protein
MEFLSVSQQRKDDMETETVSEKLKIRSVLIQLVVQGDFIEGFN